MFPDFLDKPAEVVAPMLLGCLLVRKIDNQEIIVRIVETEAYDELDEASHSFRGETPRNRVMFGDSGQLYVYFTYGMHYCCNIVTGSKGHGSAVLIRAVEPLKGTELIEQRRHLIGLTATNGPAKLCQALCINMELNGHDLKTPPLELKTGVLASDETISQTTRIGISRAANLLRRYYITGNPYVSKR